MSCRLRRGREVEWLDGAPIPDTSARSRRSKATAPSIRQLRRRVSVLRSVGRRRDSSRIGEMMVAGAMDANSPDGHKA